MTDVGQAHAEEVNFVPAGSPGGVNFMEGMECIPNDVTACDATGLTLSVTQYGQSRGNCAVVGGHVNRGAAQPGMFGYYFFADFCTGRLWTLQRQPDGSWLEDSTDVVSSRVSAFGEDELGEIYLVDYEDGRVLHIAVRPRAASGAQP